MVMIFGNKIEENGKDIKACTAPEKEITIIPSDKDYVKEFLEELESARQYTLSMRKEAANDACDEWDEYKWMGWGYQ